jgi:hypothetical protein
MLFTRTDSTSQKCYQTNKCTGIQYKTCFVTACTQESNTIYINTYYLFTKIWCIITTELDTFDFKLVCNLWVILLHDPKFTGCRNCFNLKYMKIELSTGNALLKYTNFIHCVLLFFTTYCVSRLIDVVITFEGSFSKGSFEC